MKIRLIIQWLALVAAMLPGQPVVYFRMENGPAAVNVSNVTQGATGPATVTTATAHGFATGDRVFFDYSNSPCADLNGVRTVTVVNATQFTVRDRTDTADVRCELGWRIYFRMTRLSDGTTFDATVARAGAHQGPQPEVTQALYNSLAENEAVTLTGLHKWSCANYVGRTLYVKKMGSPYGVPQIAFTDTVGGAALTCTNGYPYIGDGRDFGQVTAGKTTAVTLADKPVGPFTEAMRSRMPGRASWNAWVNSLKPNVDSLVADLGSPGSLQEKKKIAEAPGSSLSLATAYLVSGNSVYLNAAKRWFSQAEYIYAGLTALPWARHYGRTIQQQGHYPRFSYAGLGMAYMLLRDELTAGERAEFANRILTQPELESCSAMPTELPGKIVRNGNRVLGSGTNFLTTVQAGDMIMLPYADSSSAQGADFQGFGQAFVEEVISDTVLRINYGSERPNGTVTEGSGDPVGSCAEGSAYLKPDTMTNGGRTYPIVRSFACRGGTWIRGDDPSVSLDTNAMALEVAGTQKVWVMKPWQQGQCGYWYLIGLYSASMGRYDNRYYGYPLPNDVTSNHSFAQLFSEVMLGLALIQDDARAAYRLEISYNQLADRMMPWIKRTYAGAPTQFGSGYYVAIFEENLLEALLAVRNQTVSPKVDWFAGSPKWMTNLVHRTLYGWYPGNPAIGLRYGEQPGSHATYIGYQQARLLVTEHAAPAAESALLRHWLYDVRNIDNSAGYWGPGHFPMGGAITHLWFSDPAQTKTALTGLPLQRLFRGTDQGDHTNPNAANYSMFQGWMSRTGWGKGDADTLVWQDFSACCVDHYQDYATGNGVGSGGYSIVKGGSTLLAPIEAGNNSTVSCDTDGTMSCFVHWDDRNMVPMVLVGSGDNGSGYERVSPRPVLEQWAGSDPGGVADNSYVYAAGELKRAATSVLRHQRHMLHMKKPGQPDYLVVYDDVQLNAAKTLRSIITHRNSGRSGEGNIAIDAGAGLVASQTANGSAKLVSQFMDADGQAKRIYQHNASRPGVVTQCPSTDGATCAAVPKAEFMVVHMPTTDAAKAMPPVTMLTADSNWRVLQIGDAAQPYVAAVRPEAKADALSFTSTHAGTALYVVTNLYGGTYSIKRGGVEIGTRTVTAGQTTLSFESAAGLISVARNRAADLVITSDVLTAGAVGSAYTASLTKTGGLDPVSWSTNASLVERVDTGSATGGYVDTMGNAWAADGGWNNGFSYDYGAIPVNGTNDDRLFQTVWACDTCQWVKVVPNGNYTVRVGVAEMDTVDRKRIYNLDLNGVRVATNVEPWALGGGVARTATWLSYPVTVSDGLLTVRVSPGTGCVECTATIHALEIAPNPMPALPPPGVTLSANGVLSGTPLQGGTFAFEVEARDADTPAQVAVKTVSMTVSGTTLLQVSTATLATGTLGQSYYAELQAAGGVLPHGWSLVSGSWPAGLTMSSAGVISGVPTVAGTYPVTVRVTDSDNPAQTAERSLSLVVNASVQTLTISTTGLPSGLVGQAYSGTMAASGGTGTLVWDLASGNWPPGVTMSTTGVISGVPTAVGSYAVTVRVRDGGSPQQTATRALSVSVTSSVSPLVITTLTLPGGTTGTPYSASMAASGGTGPYTWEVAGGVWPSGLSLTAGGLISGTPLVAGSYTVTIRVRDSATPQQSVQAAFTLVLTEGIAPLSITTSGLPAGTVGSLYAVTLAATGGSAPYTWRLAQGALPAGLTLAANGAVSGSPTVAGSYGITVEVRDSANPARTAQRALILTVGSQVVPLVISSESLAGATEGFAYSQTLGATGGEGPYSWSISGGGLPAGLTLTAGGALSGIPTAGGTFSVTVQVTDAGQRVATRSFGLVVTPALRITTNGLPDGVISEVYAAAFGSSGGTGPLVWDLVSGGLPPGVMLSGSGLTGIPERSGTFTVTARVRDSGVPVQAAQATYVFRVASAGSPLTVYSMERASDGLVMRFGAEDLRRSDGCAVDVAADPGFLQVVETVAVSGGSRREWSSAVPLTAGLNYFVKARCGAREAIRDTATAAGLGAPRTMQIRVATAMNVDAMRVWFGPTAELGSWSQGSCVSGVCTANLAGVGSARAYYRYELLWQGRVVSVSSSLAGAGVLVP